MTSLLEDRFYLQQCRSSSFIFPLEADSLFAPLHFFRLKEFCKRSVFHQNYPSWLKKDVIISGTYCSGILIYFVQMVMSMRVVHGTLS